MREIEFRGKREDSGEWVYGSYQYLCGISDYAVIWETSYVCTGIQRYVHRKTVGQYTGLNDKNGAKIFEGDVLSRGEVNNDSEHFQFGRRYLYKVKYEQVGFVAEGIGFGYREFVCRDHKIIGNVHDNPEFLKEIDNELRS